MICSIHQVPLLEQCWDLPPYPGFCDSDLHVVKHNGQFQSPLPHLCFMQYHLQRQFSTCLALEVCPQWAQLAQGAVPSGVPVYHDRSNQPLRPKSDHLHHILTPP